MTGVIIEVYSETEMKQFGARLGALLRGGETIELVGDVGAGKTTLTKGIALGMKIDEDVQSPSFTISRVYEAAQGLELAHYDFYRLHDAGIMANELHETLHNPKSVTIIEWADIIKGILPKDHLRIGLTSPTETTRRVELVAGGAVSGELVEQLA
ncbi:tRNA threonylcarbamoyladenosine biosynthesis protein TsaE [compost metagenome]